MGSSSSTYLQPQVDVRERVREAENTGTFSLVGAGAPNFPLDLLRKLTALEGIDLSNNPIKAINAEDLRRFSSLLRVNYSGTALEAIPDLSCTPSLVQVKVNGMPHLRENIKNISWSPLSRLKELSLCGNDLDALPNLSQNLELEVLAVVDNKLTALPAWLGKLPALRELSCGDNDIRLDELPEQILAARIKIIDGLYLGGAESAANWNAIQERNITHVLSVVKKEPPFPDKLKYLVLEIEDVIDVNIVAYLPKAHAFIEEGIKTGGVVIHCAAGVSRSASVVVSYLMRSRGMTYRDALRHAWSRRPCIAPNPGFERQLGIYEKVGFEFSGAKYDALLAQRLAEATESNAYGVPFLMLPRVPDQSLTILSLHQNLLEELPTAIGDLSALEELRINCNSIRELPDEIGKLVSLHMLDVSVNKLSSVPHSISGLQKLCTLNLSRNILLSLPEDLSGLTSLQRIDLSCNKLSALPASMEQLTSLESLTAGGNQKLVLPKWAQEIRKKTHT